MAPQWILNLRFAPRLQYGKPSQWPSLSHAVGDASSKTTLDDVVDETDIYLYRVGDGRDTRAQLLLAFERFGQTAVRSETTSGEETPSKSSSGPQRGTPLANKGPN